MNDTCLDSICSELKQEQERLAAHCEGLRAELKESEKKLKRVQAGIKALAAETGSGRASRKPSAGKAEVIQIVEMVLAERGAVAEEELRSAVERKVVESGRSRMGLALRFKEALGSSQFRQTSDGVRLAATDRRL